MTKFGRFPMIMNQATSYATVVLFGAAAVVAAAEQAPVAFITDCQGTVRIANSDTKASRKAYVLDYLFGNDTLRTGPESRAVVVFTESGRQEVLEENSLAIVAASRLDVQSGNTSVAVATIPLPAIASLDKMSKWVTDSSNRVLLRPTVGSQRAVVRRARQHE